MTIEIVSIDIAGVSKFKLKAHADNRGSLTEYFRGCWSSEYQPLQWSVTTSSRNVLRGMHVHLWRCDYLFVLSGEMTLGLCDIRPESPTFMHSWLGSLNFEQPQIWLIPPGVAHGFYTPEDCMYLLGTSTYWSMDDEFSCLWNDPELDLSWGVETPELSSRDANAGSLAQLVREIRGLKSAFLKAP